MFGIVFWIVTLFVLFLIAYGITQMIMKPIKERQMKKQWNDWRKYDKVGAYRG
jgi:hypothetical protein